MQPEEDLVEENAVPELRQAIEALHAQVRARELARSAEGNPGHDMDLRLAGRGERAHEVRAGVGVSPRHRVEIRADDQNLFQVETGARRPSLNAEPISSPSRSESAIPWKTQRP